MHAPFNAPAAATGAGRDLNPLKDGTLAPRIGKLRLGVETMQIGIVGLGFMGSTHFEAYQNVRGFELAAVASSSDKKLAGDLSEVGGNLGRGGGVVDFGPAARYTNADELIEDPLVEAVDICTPTHLHKPLALRALEAGKHVLVEKPMALSVADCEQMIVAARDAGRVLMVAQVLRFFPEYATARAMVVSGELGSVRAATFRRRCAAPAWGRWLKDPAKSGGGALDLLIHDFDFCQHLFGKPRGVRAVGPEDLSSGIDFVQAQLDYGDGVPVIVSGGWHHPASFPFSMEFTIICDGGTLDYSSDKSGLRLHSADGEALDVELPKHDGFEAELQAFVDGCISGKAPALCRPEDSAEAIGMALAMNQSRAAGGECVPVT